MRRLVPLLAALALLIISSAAVPPAAGHGGHDHTDDDGAPAGGGDGGLAPKFGGVSTWGGVVFWGDVVEVSTAGFAPKKPHAQGDWVVWEAWNGSRSDVHAYNTRTQATIQLTDDAAYQCNPRVHGDIVVWEDYRTASDYARCGKGDSRVWVHDLRTGISHAVVDHPSTQRHPDVGAGVVVWADHRSGNWDVYAHNISSGETYPIADSANKEVTPVIVGGLVAWRDYTHLGDGQWDVFARPVGGGNATAITRDLAIEERMQADGSRLYFMKKDRRWGNSELWSYDARTGAQAPTGVGFGYHTGYAVEDGVLVSSRLYVDGATLNLVSLREDHATPLTFNRGEFGDWYTMANGTVYTTLTAENRTRLLAFTMSPLATSPPPQVHITRPTASELVYNQSTASGFVTQPGPWGPPKEVLVRVDEGAWMRADGASEWRLALDGAELSRGSHTLTVAAVYDEAPPQYGQARFLAGPPSSTGLDLDPYYEKEAVPLSEALLSNPVFISLLVLLILVVVLLVARTYLRWLRKRPRPIEYVPPDEAVDDGGDPAAVAPAAGTAAEK